MPLEGSNETMAKVLSTKPEPGETSQHALLPLVWYQQRARRSAGPPAYGGEKPRPKRLAKPEGVGTTIAEHWTAAYGRHPLQGRHFGSLQLLPRAEPETWAWKPLQRAKKQALSITKLRLPQVVLCRRKNSRTCREGSGGTQRSQEVHGPQGAIRKRRSGCTLPGQESSRDLSQEPPPDLRLGNPLIPAQNLSHTHNLLTPAPSTLSRVSQGLPGPWEWDSRQEEGESKGLGHSHQEAGVDPTRARGLVGHSGSKTTSQGTLKGYSDECFSCFEAEDKILFIV